MPPDARLVDNETGHPVEVSGDDDLVERYRTRLAEWQAEIGAFVSRRGGAYVARPLRPRPRRPPVRRAAAPEGRRMIAPLALIGLVALPIIVAFYMLRLRRRDVPVGSTFLWQQLVRDVEANAPWQRLRFSWLLLLQLLIAALVVFAAARPFMPIAVGPGGQRRAHRRHERLDGAATRTARTAWRWRARARRVSSAACRRAAGSRSWPPPTRRPSSSARPTTARPRSRPSRGSRRPSCRAT